MFRFTIRELVLVTTVVAISVAWIADHYVQQTRAESRGVAAASQYRETLRLRQILDQKAPGWESQPVAKTRPAAAAENRP